MYVHRFAMRFHSVRSAMQNESRCVRIILSRLPSGIYAYFSGLCVACNVIAINLLLVWARFLACSDETTATESHAGTRVRVSFLFPIVRFSSQYRGVTAINQLWTHCLTPHGTAQLRHLLYPMQIHKPSPRASRGRVPWTLF